MKTAASPTIGITASIGAAALVLTSMTATGASSPPPAMSPEVQLVADTTALILCGTTCPTPDEFWIESIKDQFVAPTHPGQDIEYIGVSAPMEFWPITGLFRLILRGIGPQEIWGPDGPGWPDEPLWKLSGLFDRTADQSLREGVADLENAMATHGNDHLVIYGNSMGAGISNVAKKHLAERYPLGTTPPDIDFVVGGDPNLPNGGLMSRFAGLYIPIVDLSFNGSAATDTQFKTVEINRQYDGFSDFPMYPLNLIADINAVLGVFYVHAFGLDVSMAPDAATSPNYQGTHGDTSYYFFNTPDLPLFGPLRTMGVPEKLIDVVEPVFRVLVELGYDRSVPAWEPTSARLLPKHDPGTIGTALADAIHEGIGNARTLVGLAPLPNNSTPVTMTVDTPVRAGQAAAPVTATTSPPMPAATSMSAGSRALPASSTNPTGATTQVMRPSGRLHPHRGDPSTSRTPARAAAGARSAATTHQRR